jgi:hypothetical protein
MNERTVLHDIYTTPTDFGELAVHYPPLKPQYVWRRSSEYWSNLLSNLSVFIRLLEVAGRSISKMLTRKGVVLDDSV